VSQVSQRRRPMATSLVTAIIKGQPRAGSAAQQGRAGDDNIPAKSGVGGQVLLLDHTLADATHHVLTGKRVLHDLVRV
jgi:hypothetical protein